MRTIGLILVVAATICCFVFVPGAWLHVKEVKKDFDKTSAGTLSDETVIDEANQDLGKKKDQLRARYAKVYSGKVKAADIEAKLQAQQKNLADEERILQRANEILKSNPTDSTIVIGGANFSWSQLNDESLERLSKCQMLKKQIEFNKQSLKQLQQGIQDGLKTITEQAEKLRQDKTQIDFAELELAALRSQEEVRQLVGDITSSGNSSQDLGFARRELQNRLNEMRANVEFNQQGQAQPQKSSTIPWNKELGIPDKQAAEGIDAYFHKVEKPKVEKPAAPAPKQTSETVLPNVD